MNYPPQIRHVVPAAGFALGTFGHQNFSQQYHSNNPRLLMRQMVTKPVNDSGRVGYVMEILEPPLRQDQLPRQGGGLVYPQQLPWVVVKDTAKKNDQVAIPLVLCNKLFQSLVSCSIISLEDESNLDLDENEEESKSATIPSAFDLSKLKDIRFESAEINGIVGITSISPREEKGDEDKVIHAGQRWLTSGPVGATEPSFVAGAGQVMGDSRFLWNRPGLIELYEELIPDLAAFLYDIDLRYREIGQVPNVKFLSCPSGDRRFFFDVRKTRWGHRVHISQLTDLHRSVIGVPLESVIEFRDSLTRVIDFLNLEQGLVTRKVLKRHSTRPITRPFYSIRRRNFMNNVQMDVYQQTPSKPMGQNMIQPAAAPATGFGEMQVNKAQQNTNKKPPRTKSKSVSEKGPDKSCNKPHTQDQGAPSSVSKVEMETQKQVTQMGPRNQGQSKKNKGTMSNSISEREPQQHAKPQNNHYTQPLKTTPKPNVAPNMKNQKKITRVLGDARDVRVEQSQSSQPFRGPKENTQVATLQRNQNSTSQAPAIANEPIEVGSPQHPSLESHATISPNPNDAEKQSRHENDRQLQQQQSDQQTHQLQQKHQQPSKQQQPYHQNQQHRQQQHLQPQQHFPQNQQLQQRNRAPDYFPNRPPNLQRQQPYQQQQRPQNNQSQPAQKNQQPPQEQKQQPNVQQQQQPPQQQQQPPQQQQQPPQQQQSVKKKSPVGREQAESKPLASPPKEEIQESTSQKRTSNSWSAVASKSLATNVAAAIVTNTQPSPASHSSPIHVNMSENKEEPSGSTPTTAVEQSAASKSGKKGGKKMNKKTIKDQNETSDEPKDKILDPVEKEGTNSQDDK